MTDIKLTVDIIMRKHDLSIDRNEAPLFEDSMSENLVYNTRPTDIEYNDCDYFHLFFVAYEDQNISEGDWVFFKGKLGRVEFIEGTGYAINVDGNQILMNLWEIHSQCGKVVATSFDNLDVYCKDANECPNGCHSSGTDLEHGCIKRRISRIPEDFMMQYARLRGNISKVSVSGVYRNIMDTFWTDPELDSNDTVMIVSGFRDNYSREEVEKIFELAWNQGLMSHCDGEDKSFDDWIITLDDYLQKGK